MLFVFRQTLCDWPMGACNCGAIVIQCWPEQLTPIAALHMDLPQNGRLATQLAIVQHLP